MLSSRKSSLRLSPRIEVSIGATRIGDDTSYSGRIAPLLDRHFLGGKPKLKRGRRWLPDDPPAGNERPGPRYMTLQFLRFFANLTANAGETNAPGSPTNKSFG